MFSPLIEKYFFINYIPGTRLFSLPYNVYIYIFLIIGFFTILFLKYNNFFEKKDLQKTIFIFLITIWFLSGITWLITEINWLRLDINNFFNKTLDQKRNNIINKVIKGYNMPENWHDFYLFLQKAKLSLAQESKVFFVPEDPVFVSWAKYYLFPKLDFVSLEEADYIIGFNVSFKEKDNYELFKDFGDKRLILKKVK